MNQDERDQLTDIHEDVREVRRNVERLDERTERIDKKTDRIDKRVFGRDGIEESVHTNSRKISRLNAIGGIVASATATVVAKVFNFLP